MEYFEVYNEKGESLHKVVERGTKLKKGEFFLVVHVWLQNPFGEYLIQQRAKPTDPTPFQWATTTGIPNVNESLEDAAVRETKEELGLTLDKHELKKCRVITTTQSKYQTITHVYRATIQASLDALKLDGNEVKAVRFVNLKTILAMIDKGGFWDYRKLLNDAKYFTALEGRYHENTICW